jgi:hypothetical protein
MCRQGHAAAAGCSLLLALLRLLLLPRLRPPLAVRLHRLLLPTPGLEGGAVLLPLSQRAAHLSRRQVKVPEDGLR